MKNVKDDHSSWKPISGKNGDKFQHTTPETHNLDAQMYLNFLKRRGDALP